MSAAPNTTYALASSDEDGDVPESRMDFVRKEARGNSDEKNLLSHHKAAWEISYRHQLEHGSGEEDDKMEISPPPSPYVSKRNRLEYNDQFPPLSSDSDDKVEEISQPPSPAQQKSKAKRVRLRDESRSPVHLHCSGF